MMTIDKEIRQYKLVRWVGQYCIFYYVMDCENGEWDVLETFRKYEDAVEFMEFLIGHSLQEHVIV